MKLLLIFLLLLVPPFAFSQESVDLTQRGSFLFPPCPPDCTIVLYAVPYGFIPKNTEAKGYLISQSIPIPKDGFAYYLLTPARTSILVVATTPKGHDLLRAFIE